MNAYCVGEMTVVGVIMTEREGSRMPKREGGGVDISVRMRDLYFFSFFVSGYQMVVMVARE